MKLGCRLKREPGLLLGKAIESLTLAIELFNRPSDSARGHSPIIMLDHSFEMFLKAAILHRGGRIRDPGEKYTIGFETCIKRAYSTEGLKFLKEEEILTLRSINSLRDAAQHHIVDMSEQQHYVHVQSGVTLFRDLMKRVFNSDPPMYMSRRVLPVSTTPPVTIEALFDSQIDEVRKLLMPTRRRQQEAIAALRPLVILDRALRGEEGQPSEQELQRLAKRLKLDSEHKIDWKSIFTGAAHIDFVADSEGPSISLRIEKREGIPVQLVSDEADDSVPIAAKRVNELGYYSLTSTLMTDHLKLSMHRFVALSRHLDLEGNPDYCKNFKLTKGSHPVKRFSKSALEYCKQELGKLSQEEFDKICRPPKRPSKN